MALPEHSKIINKVARKKLKEYGIIRKGQSRKWFDDQYWFTIGIEFQPSMSKGTYLNVGINFLWYQKSYFSYDIGYRESGFIDFINKEQFENEMNSLVELALNRTLEYRKRMIDIKTARKTIFKFTRDEIWGNYHRAIISGLNNEDKKAEKYFNLILENKLEFDWELELKNRVETLKKKLIDVDGFKKKINSIIKETRKEQKLKEVDEKNVWQQW